MHFTLDLDQLHKILEYRYIQTSSFLVTNVELEYMFETLGIFMTTSRQSSIFY